MAGESGTGKTSLLSMYIKGKIGNTMPTIGLEFCTKEIQLSPDLVVKLQLWDTGGQERFKSLALSHYRKALGVFLLFDVTSRKSFEACTSYIITIRENSDKDCLIYLIGNKIDLIESRVVQRNEAEIFAKNQGVIYKEISALQNRGVKEVFEQMVYGK